MIDLSSIQSNTTIHIPSGVHYISEPIMVHGENIRIIGGDNTELRGTLRLKRDDFTEVEAGVYSATVPCEVDGLYIDDRKYTMARYPKMTNPNDIFGGYAEDCIYPEKVKEWADPTGGYIHAMHSCMWGGFSYRIEGKNDDNTLILNGGWQNNRQDGMHQSYRFAENIREEMTEPGEWVYSSTEGKVYVRPFDGADLDTAEIVVLSEFFILDNCKNVSIENISFCRSSRTFMETKEPLLRSDWTICRKGAVTVRDSSDCTIDKCNFHDIGSNGIFVDGNSSRIAISRSHIADLGASGVCFVGRSSSVRSPLFEFKERQAAADMDKTPGPKSDDYPKNCIVEDCLIERVGTTEKQATGVEISMSYKITVKNCTICHTSRSGINISEGTFGGHRIEGCDVFDTVRETGDHGSLNSWGRDRFWHLTDTPDTECGQYASLDMLAPNEITRSRFRCDRGWDIDLDDGSSYYILTENLCLNGGIKLREGFHRTVRNNIMVDNAVHCHVWYPDSYDIVENNIIFRAYPAPILMPENWTGLDKNILHTPSQTTPGKAKILKEITGLDENSICLDCDFVAPDKSDYRPQNPALKGFENFPNEFGVRYEPLRAIADTPVLPKSRKFTTADEEIRIRSINGVTVRNIANDGEMTVYGTSGHNGALVLGVEGAAQKRGLEAGDVIVEYNNSVISDVDDISHDTDWSSGTLLVLRNQCRMIL
ncbi:MAG: PDZ domain-containing protein [Ruminococcaceae bacterium]|nr:PDZ domain-containing protein [Oscillospiraceae bacterium]